jgi:hypothetical protein
MEGVVQLPQPTARSTSNTAQTSKIAITPSNPPAVIIRLEEQFPENGESPCTGAVRRNNSRPFQFTNPVAILEGKFLLFWNAMC